MRLFRRTLRTAIYLGLLFAVFPQDAHAYIDPGSSGYFWQVLVGIFAGAVFTLKHWWQSIVAFLKRLFSKQK